MTRHSGDEGFKEIRRVVRPGTRLGVPLETVGGHVFAGDALQRAIEQRAVGHLKRVGQIRLGYREAMVLTGHHHGAI